MKKLVAWRDSECAFGWKVNLAENGEWVLRSTGASSRIFRIPYLESFDRVTRVNRAFT